MIPRVIDFITSPIYWNHSQDPHNGYQPSIAQLVWHWTRIPMLWVWSLHLYNTALTAKCSAMAFLAHLVEHCTIFPGLWWDHELECLSWCSACSPPRIAKTEDLLELQHKINDYVHLHEHSELSCGFCKACANSILLRQFC